MPSPIAHCIAGASIYIAGRPSQKIRYSGLLGYMLAANLPDIDFFKIGRHGVEFTNAFHHGPSHSISFVCLLLLAAYFAGGGRTDVKSFLFLAAALGSHLVLDMLTEDTTASINGYGIQLFWPFSDEYFISPLQFFRGMDVYRLFELEEWKKAGRELWLVMPICLYGGWKAVQVRNVWEKVGAPSGTGKT